MRCRRSAPPLPRPRSRTRRPQVIGCYGRWPAACPGGRMAEADKYDELVRRLAAAARGASLYSPEHPIVQRGADALAGLCQSALQRAEAVVIGFIGDEVGVNGGRLLGSAASLGGFVCDLHE